MKLINTLVCLCICFFTTIKLNAQSNDSGTTPDALEVSITGAANYVLPITVPPGIRGVEPELSITFSSQAGNGLAGYGWNVGGLSTITRVASTTYHDGTIDPVDFDNLDRFALDGQRLLLKSGTYGANNAIYQTENYSNVKIISVGTSSYGENYGPESFTVLYPDGSRGFYGSSSDSTGRLEWALTRWEDPQGNYVRYSYSSSGGLLRIASVLYGSRIGTPPPNRIDFTYANRNRTENSNYGGLSFSRTNILNEINVLAEGNIYRKYILNHESNTLGYQRVVSIEEYNGDNDKHPSVLFNYGKTDDSANIVKRDISGTDLDPNNRNANTITGDFDGDGKMDVVFYDKEPKQILYLLNDLQNQTNVNQKEIYNTLENFDEVIVRNALDDQNKLSGKSAVTLITDTYESGNNSEVTFKTVELETFGFLKPYSSKTWTTSAATSQTSCGIGSKRKTPKRYISGDFNGDAITDVIALVLPYSESFCNDTEDCNQNINQTNATESGNPIDSNTIQDSVLLESFLKMSDTVVVIEKQKQNSSALISIPTECCECEIVQRGQTRSFFINLDRRIDSDFSNFSGALTQNVDREDPVFAADFNGDGKSELVHIKNGTIDIYELSDDNTLQKIVEFTDENIKIDRPILPGDYNGDGKFDIIFALSDYSTSWFSLISNGIGFEIETIQTDVEYRESYISRTRSNEFSYVPQDFNGDGKTDILRHYISLNLPDIRDQFREDEIVTLHTNVATSTNGHPSFEEGYKIWIRSPETERYGIPIFLDSESNNQNLEYAYISDKQITSWVFEKDNRTDNRLDDITNNGVFTEIGYSLVKSGFEIDGTEPYNASNIQSYPYVNLNNASSLKIVSAIKRKGSNITQQQEFRYEGLVSHVQGLGFLGFEKSSRSNWYGDGVKRLFNTTIYDPKLRGAPLLESSSTNPDVAGSESISEIVYDYLTVELSNKTFINIPNKITTNDNIKGFTTVQNFIYDDYYNPKSTSTTYPDGSVNTDFEYFDNPSPNNQNYHIGRPKNKIVRTTINGNTFYEEEEYTYLRNLPETRKNRGQGTPWITETYSRDDYGNTLNKSLSAPNESTRTESFTYDDSGRYIETSQDIEGLTSVFTYYTDSGNVKTATDPYNRTTSYTYDSWNRPKTQRDYLGKFTSTTYSNTPDGGFEQFVDYPEGSDTREIYNAFGWLIEERQLSLNNNWITTRNTYDAAGRQVRVYQPYFSTSSGNQYTSTNYDEYGRPIDIISYTGEVQTIRYDGLTTTVDDGTKTVRTVSDTFGNTISMTDPGGTVSYTYYGNGTMKTAEYNGQTVEVYIDEWGRKTKLTDPSAGTYGYKYNLYGELTEESTPKGVTVYSLDGVGKLETKTLSGDKTNWSIAYKYKSNKLLQSISGTDNINNRSYNYTYEYDDNFQRPIKVIEINPFARFEKNYAYDGFGRVSTESYTSRNLGDATEVNVRIRNAYDQDSGILEQILDDKTNQSLWKLNEHDARGQAAKIVLGNGYEQNRDYDAFGLPKTFRDFKGSGGAGSSALRINYDFDAQRMVLNSRENIDFQWTENFDYDNLDRLKTIAGPIERAHEYDARGRIDNNSQIGDYTYGNGKDYQLSGINLNEIGGIQYAGREERRIVYNSFKKPTEIFVKDQDRVSFSYNPMLGRSHAWYGGIEENKEERRFRKHYSAISPVEIVEDRETGNIKIVTYIGGGAYSASVANIKTKNNTIQGYHYLHRDYLGSIMAITNSSGNILERTQYGAWGSVDIHLSNGVEAELGYDSILGRGYTGHEHFSSVGLIHMNGRMYDAQLGRFLSPDNFVQDPYNTQNFNRYGYVMNNPLIYGDPSGEFAWIAVVIGALIGGVSQAVKPGANFGTIFGGVLIGAASGFVGAGVGNIAAGGSFFSNAAINISGFAGGFTSGFAGGFAGGFVAGAGTSWINGGNLRSGVQNGLVGGTFGGIFGGVLNGITSGFKGVKQGRKFWNGKNMRREISHGDMAMVKNKIQAMSQNKDLDYYYDAVDGMEFNDGTIMSRDDFNITLNEDLTGNARYLGFKNGKHSVNFDLSDYEVTLDNIRATMIHEAYGHGVRGIGNSINHHKAYFFTIDSKYWLNTTGQFKKFTVNTMWKYFYNEVGFKPLPIKYYNAYIKYSN